MPCLRDRARVMSGANLSQGQLDPANTFVERPEFLTKYPASLNGSAFIDAVLNTINTDLGVDPMAQKPGLQTLFNAGGRGAVIYRLPTTTFQRPNQQPGVHRPGVQPRFCGHAILWLPAARSGYRRIPVLLGQVNSGRCAPQNSTAWSAVSSLQRNISSASVPLCYIATLSVRLRR